MNKKKIGTYPHKVYTYYTQDISCTICLNKLVPLILDSAGSHAEEHGFGKDLLIEKGYTWVLSRMNVCLESIAPESTKIIYIDTWLQAVKTAFSVRLFRVHDGQGKTFAHASTFWSIINIKTRRIAPINKVVSSNDICIENNTAIDLPRKLSSTPKNIVSQVIAEYTDLDYNGHVNSNRYLDFSINTFSIDFMKKHLIKQIEINFNSEVYHHDTILIYRKEEEKHFDLELYNKTQEKTACKIRLHFQSKEGLTEK